MLTFALRKDFTPKLGLLELAIQNVFLSNNNLRPDNLKGLYNFFITATKKEHAVDPDFKAAFANFLLSFGKKYLNDNDSDCTVFVEMIEMLNMPPDKEFYLFAAKAYRTFGRKEEALEAYKKVLELS